VFRLEVFDIGEIPAMGALFFHHCKPRSISILEFSSCTASRLWQAVQSLEIVWPSTLVCEPARSWSDVTFRAFDPRVRRILISREFRRHHCVAGLPTEGRRVHIRHASI
jgi:hypothetical protein